VYCLLDQTSTLGSTDAVPTLWPFGACVGCRSATAQGLIQAYVAQGRWHVACVLKLSLTWLAIRSDSKFRPGSLAGCCVRRWALCSYR